MCIRRKFPRADSFMLTKITDSSEKTAEPADMIDSTDATDWEDSRFLNPRKDFTNGVVLILYRLFLVCAITLDFFLFTLHGMSQPCSTSLFAAVLTASALLQCGWYALRKRQIPESLLKSLLSNTKSNCIGPQQPSKH